MAVKKSQLYSKLWQACDELRGGMDASQYKDYVLVVLFVKYLSDKAKSGSDLLLELPAGCSFDDLVALKNAPDVGERVNVALDRIAKANPTLDGVVNNADFADENKLGKGKDLVETVSKLIGVFQDPELDFSRNRAADDDLIGDAYEYLMRNFATQSGKSKGQFYTPAEVSRVMARLVGIAHDARPGVLSIYDPTCGSGSLLLRARAEAPREASLDGQERDLATIGMARMSMIIHGVDDAELRHGNTLTDPLHRIDDTRLRTFDYVVANPPFSTKNWLKGGQSEDPFGRWGSGEGVPPVPPAGCGDYAFLLHVVASMKPGTGRAAVILPHGVLFRGGAELEIRRWLLRRGLVAGVVGLPPNLFFGTGIPACILVLDKSRAAAPEPPSVFLIDAKDGFAKDGAKNRLRERDVRRIVDVWEAGLPVPQYARSVPFAEIERNGFNLNLPRYVAPRSAEVRQDLEAHLRGGIPEADALALLAPALQACPGLRDALFAPARPGFLSLRPAPADLPRAVREEPTCAAWRSALRDSFRLWLGAFAAEARALAPGFDPKAEIARWGDSLLAAFSPAAHHPERTRPGAEPAAPRSAACEVQRSAACGVPRSAACGGVLDPYALYEILLSYWAETMQDDAYLVSREGWAAAPEAPRKKNFALEDLSCDLVPPALLAGAFFPDRVREAAELAARAEALEAERDALVEDRPEVFDEEWFSNAASVKACLKELPPGDPAEEPLRRYLDLSDRLAAARRQHKAAAASLARDVLARYARLSPSEIRDLVVDRKWTATLAERFDAELGRVLRAVAAGVSDLASRYAEPLPDLEAAVAAARAKVAAHLREMGVQA